MTWISSFRVPVGAVVLSTVLLPLATSPADAGTRRVADETPQNILRLSKAAAGGVRSYHAQLRGADADGSFQLQISVQVPGRLKGRIIRDWYSSEVVMIGRTTYISGDERYFRDAIGLPSARARTLAGRWFRLPELVAAPLKKELDLMRAHTEPSRAKRCIQALAGIDNNGSLRKVGTKKLNGNPVVIVEDRGDRPGTARRTLYISLQGLPLPLRAVQSGLKQPSARTTKDPCMTGQLNKARSIDSSMRYDTSVRISRPPGAADIEKALKGSSTR